MTKKHKLLSGNRGDLYVKEFKLDRAFPNREKKRMDTRFRHAIDMIEKDFPAFLSKSVDTSHKVLMVVGQVSKALVANSASFLALDTRVHCVLIITVYFWPVRFGVLTVWYPQFLGAKSAVLRCFSFLFWE